MDNLKKLESRVGDLIGTCQRLRKENHSIQTDQQQLSGEHAKLIEKTQIARARIEAMIGRLKALERGS
jgi:cell division protein ZapB